MRQLLIAILIAAAFAGGFGYGRWYAKPTAGARQPLYWVDPMHPWYKSSRPGTAPDCGMKLVPVYPGDEAKYASDAGLPPGTLEIAPEKRQLMGIEYGAARYETVAGSIRAAARVAMDETRVAKVQTRLEGWIEQVFADATGKPVRKGDPLFTLYSPEALATQQEYLLAVKAHHTMAGGAMPEMLGSSENLVAAARKRLELWDVGEEEIERMIRTGEPLRTLTVRSPISGFVIERNAYSKQRVGPETVLYTLADLSTVWVVADVYEYEAAGVRPGQPATFTAAGMPGRVFRGRVATVLPQVDPATRTIKVRIQLANPAGELKPDLYGEAELSAPAVRRLVVPQSAVLDSGDRQTVFVDSGGGRFEPRQVKAGARAADTVEILAGLKAGERIVTSGNFLLDSESQLQSAAGGGAK